LHSSSALGKWERAGEGKRECKRARKGRGGGRRDELKFGQLQVKRVLSIFLLFSEKRDV
jgi:hypothetical protein